MSKTRVHGELAGGKKCGVCELPTKQSGNSLTFLKTLLRINRVGDVNYSHFRLSSQQVNRMLKCHQPRRCGFGPFVGLRPVARSAALLLSCLAMSHYAAQAARAACGDYVMVGGAHHAQNESTSPAGQPSGRNSPGGIPDCHGPNCHGQAPLPTVPNPLGESSGPQQWAVWNSQVRCDDQAPWYSIADARTHLSQGHIAPLERPPRMLG